jgi:hypothetical protein
VCQWPPKGRWFSPDTPVSSINKTYHQEITEILLKVVLNSISQNQYIKNIQKWERGMTIETTPVKYELDKSKNHENTNQHEHHKNIRKQTSTNTFTIYVKLEINYMNSTCMLPNWVNQWTVSHTNVVLPSILQLSIHIKGQRDGNDDMYITYWILLRLLVALSVFFLFSLLFLIL